MSTHIDKDQFEYYLSSLDELGEILIEADQIESVSSGILRLTLGTIMASKGAIFVFERNNSLDFIKEDGDKINAEVSLPIIESIFHKNSPLHDGAVIVVGNLIVSSRVTLPVSKSKVINKSYGLRHKAAIGISEQSDAVCIVISEEKGKISYIKNGDFYEFKDDKSLKHLLLEDLSE